MSIDVSNLSSKQLFELANRKLQQEQEEERRTARLNELRKRQRQLVSAHETALAAIDKELLALTQRRAQLVADHRSALVAVEKELEEMGEAEPGSGGAEPEALLAMDDAPLSPAPGVPAVFAPAAGGALKAASEEELANAILETLKGRNDMSDSLLREKLRARGFSLGNLAKQLERLVREGRISNKGGGNFALRRKI